MTFRLPNLRLILLAVAVLAFLAVFALAPDSVSPSGVAHAQSADPDLTIVNICDRTEKVRDRILANLPDVSDCSAVTESDLESIHALSLSAPISGYYDEGGNMVQLDLRHLGIYELKAGDFRGLSNLYRLDLHYNNLDELPDGLFEGLTRLDQLRLDDNKLNELPDGLFEGLTGLRDLRLDDNPGAPFSIGVELEQRGNDTFVVKVPTGAPFDMVVGLSAEGAVLSARSGKLSGTPALVPAGSTESDEITVHRSGQADGGPVTVALASASFRRYAQAVTNGIVIGLGEPLVVSAPAAAAEYVAPAILGICDRTPQVRDQILYKLDIWHGIDDIGCADVTGADLSRFTNSVYGLNFWGENIEAFLPGDFQGLYNLTQLALYGRVPQSWYDPSVSVLSELPDGVFNGLSGLEMLSLGYNDLTELPPDVFDGLSNLRILDLEYNKLVSLPDGVFDDLSSLEELQLDGNALTELPDGIFDGLSNLEELDLYDNDLTELPDGVFDGLSNLRFLNLDDNALTELPDGVFDGLSNLRFLNLDGLDGNALTELPDGVFDDLSSLESLVLYDNALTELPDGVFDGLTSLERLYLDGNALTELPDGVFDNLSNLELLSLEGNALTELPDGVFDDLASLEWLQLDGNALTELPDGVFDGLASLESLGLYRNALTELPDGVFDGLTSLERLYLNGNALTELPDGVFDNLSSLESLGLDGNTLTELPDGVFDNLSNLERLSLEGNALTELPDGVFDGLSSLEWLDLYRNALTELPDGVFGGLSSLEMLFLCCNDLTELPDGLFDGLSELHTLYLDANPGSPFTFTAELEQRGDYAFVVKMAEGAPFDVEVTLSAQDGTLSSTTVTIEGGSIRSAPVIVTPGGSPQAWVTVNVATASFPGTARWDAADEYSYRGIQTGLGEPLVLGAAEAVNTPATGAPAISGTEQVGETLTASTLGIADADGLSGATFSYQWMSSRDTEIQGATDATYILVAADAGKTIKVRVSFTDDAGNEETLTSAATAPVAAAVPSAPGPAVAVELSPSGSVDEGTEIALTMSFANLESNSDTSDTDYIFRADVMDADACEGGGMGRDRYMYKVDEDPEVRAGTISASCAHGDYTVEVSISSPGNVELASATADFTVNAPGQQQQLEPPSTDATLSGLTLSNVAFGTFDSATTGYTASVANDVTQTTVTPTTNDDGATYVIKLDGVADDDGEIPLSAGSNTITIEVTAEDGNATQTYTVTVTRAEPLSTDATLSGLALSGVDFGTFDSATTGYTAGVANDVVETTVTPTTSDAGATYKIKLGGVADADGTVSLAVGSNVITVEVTAEDGNTVKTYTITVTRAEPPAPGPAVAVELSPSGSVDEGTEIALTMSFANLESDSDTSDTDYIFRADMVNAEGCEGGGMGLDRYMYKVDEDPEVRAGTISASCAPGDYTVEVSISSPGNVELASATADFTVAAPAEQQQAQEPPLSTDATLSSLTLSDVTLAFASSTTEYAASVTNDVDETMVTLTTNDDGATYEIKLGGVTDDDGTIPLAVGSNVITIEVTAEDGSTVKTYKVTITRAEPDSEPEASTDATLSGLTLSGIDFGAFDPATTGYTAGVANDVTQTTVTPTTNDDGATYAIKLGGVAYADGVIPLAAGKNVITVEVTAEDGQTTKTYTITVTRAAPPSTDATLSGLTLSGINFGAFDSATTGYTASVANGVDETTVTPTTNDDGASYKIKLSGVAYADGTVPLAVGSNVITVEVTAEDGNTVKTYTVTVTRAAPSSTDATLSGLTLSGIDIGAFDSASTGYTASVPNDVDETTVTPTTNDDGATYEVKVGGVADADGTVPLAVGSNVIAVEVTAEDGETTKTYAITVTRAAAEPTPDSPPKTPDAPTGKVTGTGQVQLDWNDVEGATYYQVRFFDDDDADWVKLPTDEIGLVLDGSGATVSNLPDYGTYYFSVRAGNGAGLSEWSEYLTLPNPEQ